MRQTGPLLGVGLAEQPLVQEAGAAAAFEPAAFGSAGPPSLDQSGPLDPHQWDYLLLLDCNKKMAVTGSHVAMAGIGLCYLLTNHFWIS